MYRSSLVALAFLGAVACSRGERPTATTTAADSLNRDLQLAPRDTTTTALNDRPSADTAATASTPAAPAPERTRPSTAPTRQRSRPAPARSTAPRSSSQPSPRASDTASSSTAAPAASASLPAGTVINATLVDSISSRRNKVGDVVEARTTSDLKDASGRTVVPKGSTVALTITAIHESENKSDKTGTLTLAASEIRMNGQSYKVSASIDSVATQLAGRKTNAGDVAKVGAGAGVGAVVGRVLGGSTKGAVIGGVIGGAVGAQRAVETKDRDVVVPAGAGVRLTLKDKFTPTA